MGSQRSVTALELEQFCSSETIEATYHAAQKYGFERSASWYAEAAYIVEAEAERLNVPTTVLAGVIAALSPMKRWQDNIAHATQFIELWKTGDHSTRIVGVSGVEGNAARALKIYLEPNPTRDKIRTIVRGKQGYKVENFYLNLLGDESAITIDSHALYIAMGSATRGSVKFTATLYKSIAQLYRNVAARLGIAAHELQAVCWEFRRWLFTQGEDHPAWQTVFANGKV